MKKIFSLLAIAAILVFAKEAKLGFVESTKIFNEYQATAAAKSEFNEFVNTYRDSTLVLKRYIEDLKAELESQKLLLSEEARLKKLDQIETLTKSYDQFLQDIFGKSGKVEQKNDELMSPLLKKINDAVGKIAEQEGFSAVLDLSEGVLYASSELDITNLVINELNLEYGPTTPTGGEIKKLIAIFPFREENTEAVNAEFGQRCQNELYNAIGAFSTKYKIISAGAVNAEFIQRGLGRNIDDSQALTISRSLLCDYFVIGDVSKFTGRTEYSMYLKEVTADTLKEIGIRTGIVNEDIRLYESLNNDLRALLEKIQ